MNNFFIFTAEAVFCKSLTRLGERFVSNTLKEYLPFGYENLFLESFLPFLFYPEIEFMFNLTYFQTKFPIISDPGVMAVRNHLAMLGMPVPGSGEVLPVTQNVQVVHVPEVPSASLQLGLHVAQHGVQNVLGVNHGGLQEVVHALPTVHGVGGLATVQVQVQDFAKPFPRQEPLNLQHGPSVWNRLFVSKPQTFINSSPVLESSPWLARATPSAWPTKSSLTPSTTLVSPEVLPSTSLPSPVAVSSRESVLVLGSTSLQLPPFSRTGPLGVDGESVSLEELKSRSKPLVQSFAWDSLSLGSKKVYT